MRGKLKKLLVLSSAAVFAVLFLVAPVFAVAPMNNTLKIDHDYGESYGQNSRMDGDLDGDGINDIIISAPRWNGANDTGEVMIHWGGSSISTTPDITFTGTGVNQRLGDGMCVGDFNNDGVDDVGMGATETSSYAGAGFIFYGRSRAAWASVSDSSDANVSITGEAGSHFGNKCGMGDVNGDGFDDWLVGAEYASSSVGKAYLFYGEDTASISKAATSADVIITNNLSGPKALGTEVDIADVAGDAKADLLISVDDWLGTGVNTRALVINGSSSLSAIINASDADTIITGSVANENFSYPMRGADVNNDGKKDLITGADLFGAGAGLSKIFVFYGGAGLTGAMSDTDADITLTAEDDFDLFSMAIQVADVNNDGIDDIYTSANFYTAAWSGPGRLYVFFGGDSLASKTLASQADYIIDDPVGIGRIGWWISAGDVDGDGWDEIGAVTASVAATTTSLYLFELSHVAPAVTLNDNSVTSSLAGSTVRYSGTATDSDGGTIQNVQYSYDGANWLSATADDGAFDEASEYYHFDLTLTAVGSYTVLVRATDSENATTAIANYATTALSVTSVLTTATILPETGRSSLLTRVISLLGQYLWSTLYIPLQLLSHMR